jgi:uncharacterized protein YggE
MMNHSRFVASLAVALAIAVPLSQAAGQQAPSMVPQVITVGRGEVDIKPDRVRMEFGVETRAASATAAASENARRQRAILDTLLKLGIAREQIQTANLQVTPEMVYPGQGQPPKVSGYVARNTVRVEVLKLDQAGTLVDASLAKGATNIMGLQFYSSQAVEARREALVRAVKAARLDAEAMAVAAGYQLGALIEISSGAPSEGPIPMSMDMVRSTRLTASAEPTPVNPGELKVVETVSVRWAVKQ